MVLKKLTATSKLTLSMGPSPSAPRMSLPFNSRKASPLRHLLPQTLRLSRKNSPPVRIFSRKASPCPVEVPFWRPKEPLLSIPQELTVAVPRNLARPRNDKGYRRATSRNRSPLTQSRIGPGPESPHVRSRSCSRSFPTPITERSR